MSSILQICHTKDNLCASHEHAVNQSAARRAPRRSTRRHGAGHKNAAAPHALLLCIPFVLYNLRPPFYRLRSPLVATMSYAAQREKLVKLMEKEVEGDGGGAAAPYRAPRATRVKNKQPAPVQISAEQIIREANERQDVAAKAPTQRITDPEELAEYRLTRRKEFEDMVRRARFSINVWVKYAQWEESQFELERARSVWERALNIEPRNLNLWLKLAEMEMRHRNINRARNVWDRAVQLLPRHDQLWYKYAYMEEQLGNYAGCRQVFERWMQWEPPMQAWQTYVNFEMRYNEKDRARSIYQRMVSVHPTVDAWLKYAKYEEKYERPPLSALKNCNTFGQVRCGRQHARGVRGCS